MTGYHPEDAGRRDYDEAELDELLATAMDGMLAKLEAGFDPEAGLADIRGRLAAADPHREVPAPAIGHRKPGPTAGSQRLQEVCDQIDTLNACLTALSRSTRTAPFAGAAYVEAASPVLMQLRLGLANRALAREHAVRILDHVRQDLDEADRILRIQDASSLDQLIRARLGSSAELGGPIARQVQLLAEMIIRLYEDAGYAASLEPAR
jgi:hypothetical protein